MFHLNLLEGQYISGVSEEERRAEIIYKSEMSASVTDGAVDFDGLSDCFSIRTASAHSSQTNGQLNTCEQRRRGKERVQRR